jgi:hypothetical protein
LLDPLTFTCDENLVLTRPLLFAGLRKVAYGHAGMSTNTELFAAELFAGLLAFPVAVTLFLALVGATLESLSTHLSTTYFA